MEHDENGAQALLARLRAADELTVARALEGAYVHRPLTGACELLEFYNRMIDEIAGPKE